jgi:hypothetical protein
MGAIASSPVFTHRGNLDVFRDRQGRLGGEHVLPSPTDQVDPHSSDPEERSVMQVPHVQQRPDHRQLQHRAARARAPWNMPKSTITFAPGVCTT